MSPVRYSDLFATNLKRLGKTIERKDKETGKKLLYSGDKKTFRYKRHGSEAEKKSIGNIEAKIKDIEGREITKANNEFKEGEKEYLDSRSAVKINRADEET